MRARPLLVAIGLTGVSCASAPPPAPCPCASEVVVKPAVAPCADRAGDATAIAQEPGTPRAGDAGDAETMREAKLGMALLEDPSPQRLEAAAHLAKACDRDHSGACNDLGWVYATGFGVTPVDEKRARQLYVKACDLGSSLGCLNRGRLSRATNAAEAAEFMAKACTAGDEKACEELAGVVAQARNACESGQSPPSCNNWGYIQEYGLGTKADAPAAFRLYESACAKDVGDACRNAGIVHLEGTAGVAKDPKLAKARFDQACKLGNDAACLSASKL
ncbi:MAG: sel1 repeat family protein [Polyangiaceae bacterium]|nr:sel1 repeat family protein [Polyangiaceae bacterium]